MFDMTRRRKRYDKQFKVSAAEVVLSGEMTVKSLFEEPGRENEILKNFRVFSNQDRARGFGSSKSIGASSAPSRRHARC